MSNRILIRSGQGIPTIENLEELELGFDTIGKKLYIKYNNEILPIGPTKQEIVDSICKVGHILVTTNPEHPSAYLGGEWETFGPGRTIIGVDSSDENFNEVEKIGGIKELDLSHTHSTSGHSLTVLEMPSHNHNVTHSHTIDHTHSDSFSINSVSSHTHGINGSTQGNSSLDGYFRVLAWSSSQAGGSFSKSSNTLDRAAPAGGNTWGAQTFYLEGTHSHKIDLTSAAGGNHKHSISGSVSTYYGSTSNYTGSTGTTGNGNSHSHGDTKSALSSESVLNPYITVYMWKRLS